MGYYNILLTNEAKKVFTITTPFVEYEHNRLSMVVCIAPDIFQDWLISLMDNLEFFKVYFKNYLVVTSRSFEEHLAKVEEVMKRLQSTGLKFKIGKCKFAVPKVEYLG